MVQGSVSNRRGVAEMDPKARAPVLRYSSTLETSLDLGKMLINYPEKTVLFRRD